MKTFFVDESGDLGTKERYFVIAMLAPQNSKRIVNFMKRFCIGKSIPEVKASQLTFSEKTHLLNKLCNANDYTISYIVADKLHLQKKLLEDKNLCYNYLFSFLVNKTIRSLPGEDIEILLDSHSTKVKSINSLADYIKLKAIIQWGYMENLNIRYVDSKSSKVVQATDMIANAVYAKYTYSKEHFYNMLTISESIKFPQGKFGTKIPVDKPVLTS